MSNPTRHLLLALMCGVLWGCGATFQVVDESGQQFDVSRAKLSKRESLVYLYGESLQEIPLSKIITLKINRDMTMYKDDKIFYQAELMLTDGKELKATFTKKDTSRSYISVDDLLLGRTSHGSFEISLKDVIEIKQVEIK